MSITQDTLLQLGSKGNDDLFNKVVQVESAGNPNAISSKGAFGESQLMPDTAKDPGFGLAPLDPNDPNDNKRLGKQYLGKLLEKYNNDQEKALMAYNWGTGNVDNWINAGMPENKVPDETKKYVKKILNKDIKSGISSDYLSKLGSNNVAVNINDTFDAGKAETRPEYTEDINKALQGVGTNMWNAFKQGMDQTESSTWQYLRDKNQDLIDDYPEKAAALDKTDPQFYQKLAQLQAEKLDAEMGVKKWQDWMNDNTQEITKEPVSNYYQAMQQLNQAKGSNAGFWDKMIYNHPNELGSSIGLMAPNIIATYGAEGLATGLAALEVPGANVIALLGAVATAIGSRQLETMGEISQQREQDQQSLLYKWQTEHPDTPFEDLPEGDRAEILRQNRIKSREGTEQQYWTNMALAIPDLAEMLVMPGSKVWEVAAKTKGLSFLNGLAEANEINKFTKIGSRLGKAYTQWVSEKFEEGIQQAAQYRKQDDALDMGLYENQRVIKNILTDAGDTFKSLNYSPIGVSRDERGRYSNDPQFQTSEEAGGFLSMLMGGFGHGVGIASDLYKYKKYQQALNNINNSKLIDTEGKTFQARTDVYYNAAKNQSSHHMMEALKAYANTKDENGQPYMTEDELSKELGNIKLSTDKYNAVSKYVDGIMPTTIFSSKEDKQLKADFERVAFKKALTYENQNTIFKTAEEVKKHEFSKIPGNIKVLKYNDNLYQIKLLDSLIEQAEDGIANKKALAEVYEYKKQLPIIKKYRDELVDQNEKLNLTPDELKENVQVTPELGIANEDYVLEKIKRDFHFEEYNKALSAKTKEDIMAYIKDREASTKRKEKAVNTVTKEKEEEVKDAETKNNPPPPSDSTDKEKPLGTVQLAGSTEEHPFFKRNEKDGMPEWEIEKDGKREIVSFKDKWRESSNNAFSYGKEVLHGINHFTDMYTFGIKKEKEILESLAKERSYNEDGDESNLEANKAKILEEFKGAFPAIENRALLDKILQRADWKNYIKLVAINKYTGKKEQEEHPVVFTNSEIGIRGVRKKVVDIIMEITNPETGEVSILSHPYSPEYYEIESNQTQGIWNKLDFSNLPYEEFEKRFSFQYGELTPETYNIFQQNYLQAKEFFRAVTNKFLKEGEHEIDPTWYSMSPSAEFDWNTQYDKEPSLAQLGLSDAPIVFGAEAFTPLSIQILPNGMNLPPFKNQQAYYAFKQFDNGVPKFIMIHPKQIIAKDEQEEVFNKLNALREEAKLLTSSSDNIKDKLQDINFRVPFFIRNIMKTDGSGIDYTVFVKADTHKTKGVEGVSLPVDFKIEIRYGDRSRQRYFTDNITSWKDLIHFINTTDFEQDGIKRQVHINPSDVRVNIPRTATEVPNIQKQFVSSTTDKIVKPWTVKFNFHAEQVVNGVPLPLVEKPKVEPDPQDDYNEDSGIPFKIKDKTVTGTIQNINDAYKWMESKLPKDLTIEDLDTIRDQVKNHGITLGTVIGHTMYLDGTHEKNTFFHEVFHIVFRNLFSNKRIVALLRKAKEELNYTPEQLKSAIKNLRSKSPRYTDLSEATMERLVYEEYLADKYADYTEKAPIKSWLRDIFDKIKAWIKFLFNNPDIESMVTLMEAGAFRNSKIKQNYFNGDGSTAIPLKLIRGLSAIESRSMVQKVFKKYINTEGKVPVPDLIEDLINWYNPELPGNIAHLEEFPNKTAVRAEMLRAYQALIHPEAKKIITSEVLRKIRKLRTFQSKIEIEEIENLEDKERVYDVPEFERNPADRVSARVKEFLSSVSYNTLDPISQRIYDEGISWVDMYNRLLPVLNLNATDPENIPNRLSQLGKEDVKVQAVYNALSKKVGLNLDELSNPNFLQEFKTAFALRPAPFGKVVGSINKKKSQLFIVNEGKLGEYKADLWMSPYLLFKHKASIDAKVKASATDKLNALVQHINGTNIIDNPVELAVKLFTEIGLPITKGYAEVSFNNEPPINDSIEPIRKEDLLNLRAAINFNEDLYGDDRIYLIKRFSNSDAQYDTNLIIKSSQNAEGKMIYSYTADSEILSKTYDLKNEFKYKDTVKLALQDPYMSLNPYLYEDDATKNFSNLKIILTGNSQLVDEDGTSMKNSDEFSHMVMLHSLYNATEELDKQEYSWYWLTQVEAKNTQYAARLAKRSYYSENGITPLGIKHISSMVEQEINRLQGEYGTGFQAEGAVYFPFLNEPEFKGKTFNQIKDLIPAKMNEIISDMIRDQEDYLEQYDLKRYIHPNETNFQQYLGNFILNDFINTNSLLKLIIGDMAWAKNWEDFVKRNSRLIASGPNMGTTNATIAFMQDAETTVNINGKDVKVKVDDAQMYALVDQKLLDLSAHGAIDQSTELALNNIINPINEKGKYDAKRYSAIEKTTYGAKVDLVPAKQVISGETTDKKRIYQKMGIMYLTRELASRWNEVAQVWEPLRGKEKLHNMYEFMLANKVNFIAPKSASKLYFPENAPSGSDFYRSSKVKLVTVEFSNQDRRKQLDNDTHQKDTIKAGPQLINISGSELLSPEAQKLRNDQLSILNEIKQRTFNDIKKIFSPEQRAFLAQKLRDNIEKNTGDSQLIELLEDLNGDLKYGTNLLHVAAKEEEIFFSMFKDAYSTRISGRHLTHVSPEGFQVLYHIKSGRIVSSEEQRSNYDNFQSDEYAVRDLAYGEIMLPRKWMDLAGLKPGDALTNEIFKMLGVRIPAQNYHSMTTLTVADFLPDYYGDTIVAYKEIYALMGSDNDIDALYTFIKAWYNDAGTIKVYGQEKTPEEEYIAYNHDILERNSYLNAEIFDLLTADPKWKLLNPPKKGESDDITGADNASIMLSILGDLNLSSADINVEKKKLFDKYTKEVLKKYNFPSTQSEWEDEGSPIALSTSENNFIDKTHEILRLPELKEALLTPMSTTSEKEAMEEFDKYSPKIPKKQFLGNSLNAKSDSYINQFASKPLVGPAVVGNSVSQFLTEHQIDLNPEYSFYLDSIDNPYNSYNNDNIRKKADDGSSVVGTIVDSVKTPLANIFNWAKSTLGQVNVLIGIGVPFVKQALFFKQHVIGEYVKKSNFKDSPFSKGSNKRSDVYEIPRKAFERFRDLSKAIETSELSDTEKNRLYVYHEHFQNPNTLRTEDLQYSLNPDLTTLENKIRYYGTQFQVISQFQRITEVSDYLFNVSKILSTNKSAGKSVYDSKDILEAYNTIEKTNDPEAEQLPPVLGLLDVINNSDLLSDNKERLKEIQAILKYFFIKLTPFFNKIESEVKSSLKPSGDENLDTKLMTYLNGQITKKNFEKMTPPLDPVKEAEKIFLSPESLAKDIRKAQQNDALKTNPFLSFLKPLIRGHERNKTGIDLVQADSRTNLTAEATDLLLKGYAHLMVLDKALAIKAYTYLVLKDNLTFANKSFIKYINPIMFQNLANGLKIMNEAVASKIDENTIKQLTNKTSDELRDEFFDIYAGDKNNGKFIKQAKPAQLEVITGKGTTNEKTHEIFNRTIDKDILTLKLNDVPDEILKQFSTFSIKKGVVSFPQIINIGTQKAPVLYKKLENTRNTAIYKQIEQFDIPGVSPYLYSVKQIKELEKLIKPSISVAAIDEDFINQVQAREDEEKASQKNINLSPKFKIPMNFEDGTGGRQMRDEFKGKSTLELIKEGNRTATSRDRSKSYNQQDIKVGDIIEFYADSGKSKGQSILVRVTKAPYKLSEVTPEQWSKLEGWKPTNFESLKSQGYEQFQYELINKPQTGTQGTLFAITGQNIIDKTKEFKDKEQEIAEELGLNLDESLTIEYLDRLNINPITKQIIENVKKYNLEVKIVYGNTNNYNTSNNTITLDLAEIAAIHSLNADELNLKDTFEFVLGHEFQHAIVNAAIEQDYNTQKKAEELTKEFANSTKEGKYKDIFRGKEGYLEDDGKNYQEISYEFIADFMSNSDFREHIKNINKPFWRKILDFLLQLFGFEYKSSLYKQAEDFITKDLYKLNQDILNTSEEPFFKSPSGVVSSNIDDALAHPERYDTIALDFDGTVVDTNAGIREGLGISPKEYYAQGENISNEDRNKVWDKAPLTSLGKKLMDFKRSGTYPMDKIKVITAGSFRKSHIASLLGIPEENVIIVTNPDTIEQYNLQDDVALDKALILSTFLGKTLYIDDKFKNIAAIKKLENVESMRYDSGNQDDSFIPKNKLQKSLLDTQQHLISRLEELGKQTGGENRKVVQSRIDTISTTINRLTKQGSYDILIGTAYSELRAVNAFIKEGTIRSLNEAKKILTWYSDFYQEMSSDPSITSEQNTKLIDINNKIVQLNNRLNPALEDSMFNHSKRVGMKYSSADQMLAAQKDISAFTKGGLTPNETNIPIGRTIMKTLSLIDLKINEAVQEVNRKADEIRKNLDKNWMERVFDKAGRFITEILPDYWDEQASVMRNLAEIKHKFYKDKSGTKADIKEAYQKVFDWHKDNNVYTYTKEDEEKYLEDYAYQKEFVFTNENDEVDRAGLEEWAFENGPFTGTVDPSTRIVDLSNVKGPKFKDGKYNTKWYQYLTVTPTKKWENPEYNNVKDDEVYKFLRDLLEKAIKKLPHRATVDKDNFEKFLDSFKLDITSSGPKLRESVSGLKDFIKDSLMLTINASDLDASARSILDEKGYRKPYLRSIKITDIQKEVKDPFEAVLKFYEAAVAFEHKNLMEPTLLLLQNQLEHQDAYETNVTGNIKKTILKGGVKYPELIQNGLIKAAENTKYQIEARLYGKTRRDEDKRTLTPQELDEVQQWREEVKDWIKNGSIGERPKEPEFNKLTISKISDAIVDYTRIVKLGGGLFSGANNLAMGMLSNYNYAVRNKEFNAEDLDWATMKVMNSTLKYWFGVPFSKEKRLITPIAKKIAFARKKFGLDKGVMELGESNKPKWIEAAVEALMTFQEGGEYLIHAQLMLAMMRKIKVKNLKGEEKSLWDAYDDEFQWKEDEFGPSDEWNKYEVLDSNGQNVSKLLKFNDDLNKLRVITQSDYQNPLMVKSKYQNRIFMLFRTWIPKAVHNRFGEQIDDDFKGRYRSYVDIKGQLGKNSLLKLLASIIGASALKVLNVPFGVGKYSGLKKLSNIGLDKIEDYFNEQGVSDLDIENFRANIKELQHLVYFIGVWTLFASLSQGDGDDDDWMYNYMGNLGMRVSQDLSFFYYPDSFLGIIKDPIPIMSTIKDVQELASAAVDYIANPNKRNYKRGFRRGQSKVLKELSDLIPLYHQVTSTQSLINQIYGTKTYKYAK